MPDRDYGVIEPVSSETDVTEPGAGFLHLEEKQDNMSSPVATPGTTSPTVTSLPISSQMMERVGTAEHLAARRPIVPLDTNDPAIKQRLNTLRVDVTRLVTDLRWGGQNVDAITERLIPLLDIGPIFQWKTVLIPFLFEIDRAGNLLPAWFKIIEQKEVSPTTVYTETPLGRARRYALLMLGNYRNTDTLDQNKSLGFLKPGSDAQKPSEMYRVLYTNVLDPNTSLYASQSLIKQNTTQSLQVLVRALSEASGWAKVDIVEALLSLKQARFNDLIIADGLSRVPGLESYVAIPVYKELTLAEYLRADDKSTHSLQAALLFAQVLRESMTLPQPGSSALPPALEGDLPGTAQALFDAARLYPAWQYAVALHALGGFLGLYWTEISRGAIHNQEILVPIQTTAVLMNVIDPWMAGPGRDVLLSALNNSTISDLPMIARVLGELRDPRAISPLSARIASVNVLEGREQALSLASACETLAQFGDVGSVDVLQNTVTRLVPIERRLDIPKRRDNLPQGDAEIPASILYAAIVRACGQLADRRALDLSLRATADFDPYVRARAVEALPRLDPHGEDRRSRAAIRAALTDPRESIARTACTIVGQYRDLDAIPILQHIVDAHNALSPAASNALHQLG